MHCQDVEDLQREVVGVEGEALQVSRPAAALSKRVESLINQVDRTLHALGVQYLAGNKQVTVPMGDKRSVRDTRHTCRSLMCDLYLRRGDVTVATSDLCRALTALEGTAQESKVRRILSVLDEDHDGVISLEELTEVCTYVRVGGEGRGGEEREGEGESGGWEGRKMGGEERGR